MSIVRTDPIHFPFLISDAETYGGSNVGNYGGVLSEDRQWMGRERSVLTHLPPLAVVAFKLER